MQAIISITKDSDTCSGSRYQMVPLGVSDTPPVSLTVHSNFMIMAEMAGLGTADSSGVLLRPSQRLRVARGDQ